MLSSHHCVKPSKDWISINKDVIYDFQWSSKYLSRSSHECANNGYDSLSDGIRIEQKMEKTCGDPFQNETLSNNYRNEETGDNERRQLPN